MYNLDEKISDHFTLREVLSSPTADKLQIAEQYTPGQQIIDNARYLAVNLLEPLRAAISLELGKDTPIHITSWYRCPRTNAAVGGVNIPGHLSQHTEGDAVDTHVEGMTIEEWYQFIRHHARKNPSFKFDQLIQEFNNWAHISLSPIKAERMQSLRATHGEVTAIYTPEAL